MNAKPLSRDTEAVLLLCGRFGGEKQEPFKPLSAREYGEFARWLNGQSLRPSDLLLETGRPQLSQVHEAKLERKRIDFLLSRGTAMALALERWSRGGIWVISRGDAEFPKRLKHHFKHVAPPLLYGAGDRSLLDVGGLAVIGSRDASEAALEFTRSIGAQCAKEGLAVVSGGARGVDAASMQGATEAGGVCIGVLACDLLKSSVNRQNRIGLQEGRLVLLSPFYPEASFNAGNAMGRNRYIYALSDRALVIDAALAKGGTWEGAVEDLQHGWVPLHVRTPGEAQGNAALVAKGAIAFPWSSAAGKSLLEHFIEVEAKSAPHVSEPAVSQASLVSEDQENAADDETEKADPSDELPVELPDASGPDELHEVNLQAPKPIEVEPVSSTAIAPPDEQTQTESLDMYADFLPKLRSILKDGPLNEEEVAKSLCIEKGQAKHWLIRACESGVVEKLTRPVRFALTRQGSLC